MTETKVLDTPKVFAHRDTTTVITSYIWGKISIISRNLKQCDHHTGELFYRAFLCEQKEKKPTQVVKKLDNTIH